MKPRSVWQRVRDLSLLELVVAVAIVVAVLVGVSQLGEGLYLRAEAESAPAADHAMTTGSVSASEPGEPKVRLSSGTRQTRP